MYSWGRSPRLCRVRGIRLLVLRVEEETLIYKAWRVALYKQKISYIHLYIYTSWYSLLLLQVPPARPPIRSPISLPGRPPRRLPARFGSMGGFTGQFHVQNIYSNKSKFAEPNRDLLDRNQEFIAIYSCVKSDQGLSEASGAIRTLVQCPDAFRDACFTS